MSAMVPTRAKTGPARRRWPLQNLLATKSSRLARGGLNSALPSPIADRLADAGSRLPVSRSLVVKR